MCCWNCRCVKTSVYTYMVSVCKHIWAVCLHYPTVCPQHEDQTVYCFDNFSQWLMNSYKTRLDGDINMLDVQVISSHMSMKSEKKWRISLIPVIFIPNLQINPANRNATVKYFGHPRKVFKWFLFPFRHINSVFLILNFWSEKTDWRTIENIKYEECKTTD